MNDMKYMKVFIAATVLMLVVSSAQKGWSQTDTTVVHEVASIDSSLVNVSVFDLLAGGAGGGNVTIKQDASVRNAMFNYIDANARVKKRGYRILVYSNNSQSAREKSGEIMTFLKSAYPEQQVYRNYSAPYFTVHIGNFRIKSDAMALYNSLLQFYPNAKIVKSQIDWYSF